MSAVADILSADPGRRLLTMGAVAEYLSYADADAAYSFLRRRRVPMEKRGTVCLVRLADVDRALQGYDFIAAEAQTVAEANTPKKRRHLSGHLSMVRGER